MIKYFIIIKSSFIKSIIKTMIWNYPFMYIQSFHIYVQSFQAGPSSPPGSLASTWKRERRGQKFQNINIKIHGKSTLVWIKRNIQCRKLHFLTTNSRINKKKTPILHTLVPPWTRNPAHRIAVSRERPTTEAPSAGNF